MRVCSFLPVPCLFIFFSTANAYFGYGLIRCLYNSTRDVTYLEQLFFNKMLMGEFNSTVGKYIGYTEKFKTIADQINKVPGFLEKAKKNKEICESFLYYAYGYFSMPVEPTVKLRLIEASSGQHPGMLTCTAHDFYPKQIKLTWLRNGKEMTTAVTSTEELANGNWFYQIHSQLEIIPSPGDTFSCMVEHASLMTPKIYNWESLPESERNKIAVGTAGLLLGLVFLVAGGILYKRRSNGRELVSTSEGVQLGGRI